MMKWVTLIWVACIVLLACHDEKSTSTASDESCVNPIKDPNEVKPMAQMMRTMANYCDSMRLKINAGQHVDSISYPLMPFWTAEPTDSSVLETLFFDHAKRFEANYQALMRDTLHQKENYTLVINTCIQCHSSYCSGPLKRIRKLPLDYKPAP